MELGWSEVRATALYHHSCDSKQSSLRFGHQREKRDLGNGPSLVFVTAVGEPPTCPAVEGCPIPNTRYRE
jgi:hypothetical protein